MRLSLAPLQGMTNAAYRNLFDTLFSTMDVYYTPFIVTTEGGKARGRHFTDVDPEKQNKGIHLVPQLLSNEGQDFYYFAERLGQMGYQEVNWNIGCPYPMVAKKKRGSGILPYPDLIDEFLDKACKSSLDLSVKMRLGYDEPTEGIAVMKVLNQYPLKEVIIHARTGRQLYQGSVDLEAFQEIASLATHPLQYNGDIFTKEDFDRISGQLPSVENFMLGRGVLRNPFLPGEIKGISYREEEKLALLKALHQGVYQDYQATVSGERHLLDRMKEFWSYQGIFLDPSGKLIKKIKKCKDKHAYELLIHQTFESQL